MPAARLPRWANRYPPRGFAPRSARRYTKPRGSPLLTTGTTSAVSLRGVSFARRLGSILNADAVGQLIDRGPRLRQETLGQATPALHVQAGLLEQARKQE